MTDTDIRYQVDRAARRFLDAVEWHGGKANTSQIRSRSGLGKDETQHRYRRLEELDLIEVGRAEQGYGDRDPPKIARLTGTARREIERGLLYDVREPETKEQGEDILAELKSLNETTDRLEERLNVVCDGQNRLGNRLENLVADLDSLENYVCEWTDTGETHLLALALLVEEELDVDIGKALDRVAEK